MTRRMTRRLDRSSVARSTHHAEQQRPARTFEHRRTRNVTKPARNGVSAVGRLLLAAALGCATSVAAAQSHQWQWEVINLHPAGASDSWAYAVDEGQQVGQVSVSGEFRSALWTGSAGSWVDLHPAGATDSRGRGVHGGQQVGNARISGVTVASLWSGDAGSWVNLHPAGATLSFAHTADNGQQAGGATFSGVRRASLWTGSAASRVELHPAGATDSVVWGMHADQQVGQATFASFNRAGLWTGSAASWVELHPTGASSSHAIAVHNGQQVGRVNFSGVPQRAAFWTGSAASWVDLNPAGASTSDAHDVYDGRVAGRARLGGPDRAGIWWNGTAESWEALPMPSGSWSSTTAEGIWSDQTTIRIVGWGFNIDNSRREALLWEATRPMPCGGFEWDTSIGQPGMGPSNSVRAFQAFNDGTGESLYVGGYFETAGGLTVNGIARWHGDTQTWSPLGSGMGGGSPAVNALAVFNDGSGDALYAGGLFATAGGQTASGIAKWNSDTETWSPLGSGAPATIRLAVFDDGAGPALYAGGQASSRYVGRWDGQDWTDLGQGTDGPVRAFAVFDDGQGPALFVGGAFTTAGGAPARKVARWDGGQWSTLGDGITVGPDVFAMTVFDDGDGEALYVGGSFTMAGGVQTSNIARWDGSTWSPVGTGTNFSVWNLTVFNDGSGDALYASGEFTQAGGGAASKVARWDGNAWSPLGAGMNNTVSALYGFDDGSGPALYAGGGFTTADGRPANRIARWLCTSANSADLNGDGVVDFFDVLLFLNLFAAGDLTVDFNNDGFLDFFDVLIFLTLLSESNN